MSEALRPYFARSCGLHLAAAAGFVFLVPRAGRKLDKAYMIDFVGGPSATIVSAGPSPASASARAAAAPIAAQADPDAVAVKGRSHGPIALPRPSLLTGRGRDIEEGRSPASAPASPAGPGATASAGTSAAPGAAGPASSAAGVSTDLPNFPYPWYISQVRLMLWQEWQKRTPRLDAEGTVGFSIMRNGYFTDLSVESSSGEANFDAAALAAVRAAAPFPALPSDFHEKFLKIHLALKSGG